MANGTPVDEATRATWTWKKLVQELGRLIRTDYGGKERAVVTQYMISHWVARGLLQSQAAEVVEWHFEDVDRQIKGCRKRIRHDQAEILRRVRAMRLLAYNHVRAVLTLFPKS